MLIIYTPPYTDCCGPLHPCPDHRFEYVGGWSMTERPRRVDRAPWLGRVARDKEQT